MLRCSDGSYYVGSARLGLERRLSEHNSGAYGGYTLKRLPVELVWSEHFPDVTDAIAVERQIKGWSRSKKEALIRVTMVKFGNWLRGVLRPSLLPILRDAALCAAPQDEVCFVRSNR
jgi:putative endonuclease